MHFLVCMCDVLLLFIFTSIIGIVKGYGISYGQDKSNWDALSFKVQMN